MRFTHRTSRRRFRSRLRKSALLLPTLLVLAAAISVAPLPRADMPFQNALAGSNGQQLVFYDNIGDVYSICVDGHNQYGTYVFNQCWGTPNLGRNDPPPGSP